MPRTNRLVSFILIILSALPMGIGDSLMLDGQLVKASLITLFGFSIYWVGYSFSPKDFGTIVGVWEISAVFVAFIVYFGLRGALNLVLTPAFFWNFVGMLFGVILLAYFSARLFGMIP